MLSADSFLRDFVCFQEIKITRAGLVEHDLARAPGYHCFFTHCKIRRKPSYSGVATFIRSASGLRTLACTTSLRDAQFFGSPGSVAGELSAERLVEIDAEGRVLVTDHGHFMLFNVYGPCISSGDEDEKTDERRSFKRDFLALLESRIFEVRERGRAVILVGDLNACASQLDHGFTISDAEFLASQWSKWIRGILGLDSTDPPRLVDCFRRLHPDRKDAFTCWNTQTGARENNYGTRIDYIIASADFSDRSLQSCDIMPSFMGSDHCPVHAEFHLLRPSLRPPERIPTNGQGSKTSEAQGLALGTRSEFEMMDSHEYGESEWPEHPPECSCFYRELTGKQEKLAKYFGAGAGDAGSNAKEGRGETSSTSISRPTGGDAEDRSPLPPHGVVEGSVGSSAPTNVFGGAGSSNGRRQTENSSMSFFASANRKPSLKRVDSNCSSSSSSSTGRAWGGGVKGKIGRPAAGARQSKLSFASNKQPAVSGTPAVSGSAAGGSSSGESSVAAAEGAMAAEPAAGSDRQLGCTAGNPGGLVDASSSSNRGKTNARDSAQAWKALFEQKKETPLCQHGEPSIQRTVLKQGANHNRRFYTCARSAGNWPTDRNARCNFFQWRLDGVRGYKDRPPREENAKKQRRA